MIVPRILVTALALVLFWQAMAYAQDKIAGYPATEEGFVAAAEKGDLDAVKKFLAANFPANSRDKERYTPLIRAAFKGHHDVVRELTRNGALLNLQTGKGYTALLLAAYAGHHDILNTLMDLGALPTVVDKTGDAPLASAAYAGHTEVVRELARRHVNLSHANKAGQTALHYAALRGNIEVAEVLLAYYADPMLEDKEGRLPRTLARSKGYGELATLVEKAEQRREALSLALKNPNHPPAQYWVDIMSGGVLDKEDMIKTFEKVHFEMRGKPQRNDLLIALLRMGVPGNIDFGLNETPFLNHPWNAEHLPLARAFVYHGASPNNVINPHKNTLLFGHAMRGATSEVNFLLDLGADVNKLNIEFQSPLLVALERKHAELARNLVNRGADIHFQDYWGRSALKIAQENNLKDIADFLRKKGAKESYGPPPKKGQLDLNIWRRAIMRAISEQNNTRLAMLLRFHDDPNFTADTYQGWHDQETSMTTPLNEAIIMKKRELVETLLQYNANPDLRFEYIPAAMDVAQKYGAPDIVEILQKHGAR